MWWRPVLLRLSASTACQLRCPACPVTSKQIHNNLGSGFMTAEHFRAILAASPATRHAELVHWGEIFLNKELPDIIRIAHEMGVGLHVGGVNLNYASDEALEAMVQYKFRTMVVALDGATQHTYAQYREKGELSQVLENVRRINALKKKHNSRYPKLYWQFIAFEHNRHEIRQAKAMAKQLGMIFYTTPAWDDLDVQAASLPKVNKPDIEHGACAQLWSNPQVNWDGRMLGCCHNYWGDFGNVLSDGLAPVLAGEKLSYAKQMVLGKAPARADIPCTNCHFYSNMQQQQRWLTKPFIARNGLYWWVLPRLNVSPKWAGGIYRNLRSACGL